MKIRQRLERLHAHRAFPLSLGIISRLQDEGFATVFAGGGVRDALLGQTPKDLDIATAAPPDAVEAAFPKTLAVGKAFGTIVVVEDGHSFEVTTFRKEGVYHDGRHPSSVSFTDMKEDAARRDFTVNALFYDPNEMSVIDFTGGLADLEERRLRTVGKAHERFREDRLRMLRAVRFVAQLGFTLDREAVMAIQDLRGELPSVSAERVLNEVKRFLTGSYLRSGLVALKESRLEEFFWPEISGVNPQALEKFPPFQSWENAFAALMLLVNSKSQEERLRAWKASRDSIRVVQEQTRQAMKLIDPKTTRAERLKILGGDLFAETINLTAGLTGKRGDIEKWIADYLEVAGPEGQLPKALLNGQDLIALGVEPGARMGELIKALYDEQLEGRIQSRTQAQDWIKKRLKV